MQQCDHILSTKIMTLTNMDLHYPRKLLVFSRQMVFEKSFKEFSLNSTPTHFWPHPTPMDYDLNKFEYTLIEDAFTQVTVFRLIGFLRTFFFISRKLDTLLKQT